MKSIRDIYKIGKGPSSSHTMGPERAAQIFRQESPDADRYQVILYGSLSKTGIGHGTDRVLKETFEPIPTEIVFADHDPEDIHHPNTLDFLAFQGEQQIHYLRVESIGGGDIIIQGREQEMQGEVYPENSFAEISQFCKWRYVSLSEYVEMNEGKDIWDFLINVWHTMRRAIDEGLKASGPLPGPLHLERKAKFLFEQATDNEIPQIRELRTVCSYAFAVSEQNADNGIIVTAPTCGSCGVMPAALRYMQERYNYDDMTIAHALAVGGLIGNLVKRNASISGAECGCQAEVGTACSMTAAALCSLKDRTIDQIEYAAEVAMEHQLGLTCDPICGLVQVPCIERNAVAAKRAFDAFNLAAFLTGTRNISFDMVVRTMYETGIHISQQYRETSEGGLAKFYNRKR